MAVAADNGGDQRIPQVHGALGPPEIDIPQDKSYFHHPVFRDPPGRTLRAA